MFLLIAVIAVLSALWIFGRSLWLSYVAPPAAPAGPAAAGPTSPSDGPSDSATDSPIATAAGTPPEPVMGAAAPRQPSTS